MAPMELGGVFPNPPRIPRARSDESYRKGAQEALERNPTALEYHLEQVRDARVVGFASGFVGGVAWMLLVLFVADRLT
jgi:hypothetical protein